MHNVHDDERFELSSTHHVLGLTRFANVGRELNHTPSLLTGLDGHRTDFVAYQLSAPPRFLRCNLNCRFTAWSPWLLLFCWR
jgi:hypothetical protein